MTDETKSVLDLVPGGPVRSDTFDFKGQTAHFRLLDNLETIACRTAAVKWASATLSDELGISRKDAVLLLDAGITSDSMIDLYELYILAATLTAEDGGPMSQGSPDEVMRHLADKTTPMDRQALMNQYLQFADEHDPESLSDEVLEEMMANLGKLQDPSSVKRLGSNVLRVLTHTMAGELARLRTKIERYEAEEAPLTPDERSQIRRSWAGIVSLSDSAKSEKPSDAASESPSD